MAGFRVDSLEIEIPNALGFAQISTYPEGFSQGILVTWPIAIELALSPREVVKLMAAQFNVTVLLEPSEIGKPWLLATVNGVVVNTNVRYLDEGIEPL